MRFDVQNTQYYREQKRKKNRKTQPQAIINASVELLIECDGERYRVYLMSRKNIHQLSGEHILTVRDLNGH